MINNIEELKQLVKDGCFFNVCIVFALNKGYRDVMKEKEEVIFSIGDYNVKFDAGNMHFILSHKIYFARIIIAYYQEVVFMGNNEDEAIAELLTEVEKEVLRMNYLNM